MGFAGSGGSVVLVVAPHPDDEALGCGGSIVSHGMAGRVVHVLYLTSGEGGSAHHGAAALGPLREREAVAAARVLGVPLAHLRFLRFPDGGIDPANVTQVGAVVQVLRELRPALMYVPHPRDGSFDHRAAFGLVWRAAAMAGSRNFPQWGTEPHWVPTVLGYEVWAPIEQPQYGEDITAVVDRKADALACYGSQAASAKGEGASNLVGAGARHLAGFRGAAATGGYLEAFEVLRLGRVIA